MTSDEMDDARGEDFGLAAAWSSEDLKGNIGWVLNG